MKLEKSWDRYFDESSPHYNILHNRFDWQIQRLIGPKVLDIGSGSGLGSYLSALREDIESVVAIDKNQEAINLAKKRLREKSVRHKIRFVKSDAEDISLQDELFDSIFMGELLEHVEDDVLVVKEGFRLLKKNGRLICSVPNQGKISKVHVRSYSKNSFSDLLVNNGFLIKEIGFVNRWIVCLAVKHMERQ